MEKIYKLTNENMRTYGGFQWELGKTYKASGEGPLCSSGHFHAYIDPELAVILNPILTEFENPRLFEGMGVVSATDNGLKIGLKEIVLEKELPLPEVSLEVKINFAILCAKKVCFDTSWLVWAEAWLTGKDKTTDSAWAVWKRVRETPEMAATWASWAAAAGHGWRGIGTVAWMVGNTVAQAVKASVEMGNYKDFDFVEVLNEAKTYSKK